MHHAHGVVFYLYRDSESISTQTKGIKTDESSAQAIVREDAEVSELWHIIPD